MTTILQRSRQSVGGLARSLLENKDNPDEVERIANELLALKPHLLEMLVAEGRESAGVDVAAPLPYSHHQQHESRAPVARLFHSTNLSPIGDRLATESQARELVGLEPDEQREIWQRSIETSYSVSLSNLNKLV